MTFPFMSRTIRFSLLLCTFKYNGHAVNVAARKVGYPDDYYVANWYGKHETGQYFDGRTFSEAVTNFSNLCDAFDHKDERTKPVPTPTANERRLKDAFMRLLDDYVVDTDSENHWVDDYCDKCPFSGDRRRHQICSKNLNVCFDFDTCAEAILDWYMNDANHSNGGK